MIIRKLHILFFCFVGTIAYGQNNAIISNKKPVIDTTVKSKGILGGRLSTGLENSLDQFKQESADWKKESRAFIEEMGIKDIGVKASIATRKIKKKLVAKDEYVNIKTDRRLGQYGSGNRSTVEEINVVKFVEDESISTYAQEIWWFDPNQSRIVNSSIKDNKTAQICHGPFKKVVNNVIIEQGFFFMGTKDGRWETFGPENELENKVYYVRGFLAGSNITYHDEAKKKIKQVVPNFYGKTRGNYLSFYLSGNLKEDGKLDDSVRIGRWREFYEFGTGGRLKKEWRYGKDKFDASEPILMVERDSQGKIIYQNNQKFD
jgi:antitoxin component YwqK of YwqJK toxin-antitoxin module